MCDGPAQHEAPRFEGGGRSFGQVLTRRVSCVAGWASAPGPGSYDPVQQRRGPGAVTLKFRHAGAKVCLSATRALSQACPVKRPCVPVAPQVQSLSPNAAAAPAGISAARCWPLFKDHVACALQACPFRCSSAGEHIEGASGRRSSPARMRSTNWCWRVGQSQGSGGGRPRLLELHQTRGWLRSRAWQGYLQQRRCKSFAHDQASLCPGAGARRRPRWQQRPGAARVRGRGRPADQAGLQHGLQAG